MPAIVNLLTGNFTIGVGSGQMQEEKLEAWCESVSNPALRPSTKIGNMRRAASNEIPSDVFIRIFDAFLGHLGMMPFAPDHPSSPSRNVLPLMFITEQQRKEGSVRQKLRALGEILHANPGAIDVQQRIAENLSDLGEIHEQSAILWPIKI